MRITEFAETVAVLSHSYMLILDFNLYRYIYTATLQHLSWFQTEFTVYYNYLPLHKHDHWSTMLHKIISM